MTSDEFLHEVQDEISDVWDDIPEQYKQGAKLTAEMTIEFLKLASEGKDVEEDLANIKAQMLNWKFAASARFESAFWATAQRFATTLGSVALSVLKKSAGLP